MDKIGVSKIQQDGDFSILRILDISNFRIFEIPIFR